MGNITGIISGLPVDWFVLGGILVVIALDSLRSGVGRAVAVSIAMPLASVHYSFVPHTITIGTLPILQNPMAQTALFAFFFITLYLLIRRSSSEYLTSFSGPTQVILAGAATAIIFMCVWLMEPVLNQWWMPNQTVQTVFAEQFHLFWLLAAYSILAFARG